MNKTCKIVAGVVCLISHNLIYSQEYIETNDQTIVMTEGELTYLIETIVKHKKDEVLTYNESQNYSASNQNFETIYLAKQIEDLQRQLELSKSNTTEETENEPEEVNYRELQNAQNQINDLKQRLYALEASKINAPNVHVITPNVVNPVVVQQIPDSIYDNRTNNEMVSFNKKLDSLQQTLDSQKPNEAVSYDGDFDVLKNKLKELQTEMVTSNAKPLSYDQLKNQYKGFKKELLFDNNDTKIIGVTENQLNELFNILNNNDNLDVVLKGFASAKGSAIYNEKLSMDRTEAVKKSLVLKGMHPTRILSQYHGVDYKAISAETARRVEASILVRK